MSSDQRRPFAPIVASVKLSPAWQLRRGFFLAHYSASRIRSEPRQMGMHAGKLLVGGLAGFACFSFLVTHHGLLRIVIRQSQPRSLQLKRFVLL